MPQRRLKATAPLMHVLIAIATFFLLVSSWWMMALPLPSKVFTYRVYPFQLHKNLGLTIAILVAIMLYARVAYVRAMKRSSTAPPKLPLSAVVQNVLLYGLTLTCCLSGYLSSVYSGWPTRFWWLVQLPNWGYDNDALNVLYSDIHLWTTYGLVAMMAVHVGVATYHVFRHHGFVRSMLHL
jgi:cytochrome b561